MPLYIQNDPEIRSVTQGDREQVFKTADGNLAVGNSSRPVALNPAQPGFNGISAFIKFSGAPGTFQIDLQEAEIDADVNYVTIGSVNAVNANNACRMDAPNVNARFARLNVVSLGNAVSALATIGR